ncbi:hypothetical protein L195_g038087 [Trifolium pratense]|uniref:Uncharacterized protein n=1 Tax=Trifolium pratense TaxID=57577 RepID=A0A2K3LU55_TRIPR|nr:hypothetical protein L195_g038087 [Trifolium pratense]
MFQQGILPLLFARAWYYSASLIQAYIQSNSYTIFAAIEKLLCTNPSSILVTLDFMVARFRSGLPRSQLNLVGGNTTILIGHSMRMVMSSVMAMNDDFGYGDDDDDFYDGDE